VTSEAYKKLAFRMMLEPSRPAPRSFTEARERQESLLRELAWGLDLRGVRRKPVRMGGVRCLQIDVPGSDPHRVFIHLHGGGFTAGSTASRLAFLVSLARAAGVRVVGVDYRLAPEHPFPAALDDALAVIRAVMTDPATQVGVGGVSAGGGLAVSALLAARDDGVRLPDALVCVCPWADLTLRSPSLSINAGRDRLSAEALKKDADAYLGAAPAGQPLASPVFGDLRGLPPTLIQVGSDEVLLDDARRLASRAETHGVEVELQMWPAMMHNWPVFGAQVPEGREAVRRIAGWLGPRLGGTATHSGVGDAGQIPHYG
jgi:acetyl esterase/lipase